MIELAKLQSRSNVSESGCWEWTGALSRHSQYSDRGGYGRIRDGARMVYTHRAAVLATGRDIPAGMNVHHVCHNRRCCNPEHLQVVTAEENIREAAARRYNR